MFEASRLPTRAGPSMLNRHAAAVIVPCHWNLRLFQECGVRRRSYVAIRAWIGGTSSCCPAAAERAPSHTRSCGQGRPDRRKGGTSCICFLLRRSGTILGSAVPAFSGAAGVNRRSGIDKHLLRAARSGKRTAGDVKRADCFVSPRAARLGFAAMKPRPPACRLSRRICSRTQRGHCCAGRYLLRVSGHRLRRLRAGRKLGGRGRLIRTGTATTWWSCFAELPHIGLRIRGIWPFRALPPGWQARRPGCSRGKVREVVMSLKRHAEVLSEGAPGARQESGFDFEEVSDGRLWRYALWAGQIRIHEHRRYGAAGSAGRTKH